MSHTHFYEHFVGIVQITRLINPHMCLCTRRAIRVLEGRRKTGDQQQSRTLATCCLLTLGLNCIGQISNDQEQTADYSPSSREAGVHQPMEADQVELDPTLNFRSLQWR
ncbi:hypothetical protein U1Q18_007882 [Sarracenia purpurea var. burkii]